MPEDVTLNISKDAPVPICHVDGRSWGDIVFQNDCAWTASYQENCTNNRKYVLLSATSDLKAKSDSKKFDKARKLKIQI